MAVPKWQKDLLDQYNQGLITADDYNVLVQQHKIDAILGDIEQKTHEAYKQASEEMAKKAEKRLEKFWKKYEEQRQLSIDGKITKQEFDDWIKRQTAMNQDLQNLAEVLAKDMHQTNLIAAKIAKDQMADVYAFSANYEMYTLESLLGGDYFKGQAGLNFSLYNHDTAEILLKEEQKSLLPAPSKKKLKELKQLKKTNPDVLWNMQKMQSAILQSVLQGEGALDIAKRISAVGLMNEHQAIRNARTMTTNVQNMGHNRAYLNAKDMGIKLTIQWYAVLDNRTRHSHRLMHGQTKKNLKTAKFSNGCRWPGDPEGPAEEVYNCRCTTVAWTEGMEEAVPKDSAWLQQNNMTFDEWQKAKTPRRRSSGGSAANAAAPAATSANPKVYTESDCQKRTEMFDFSDGTANGVRATLNANIYTTPDGIDLIFPAVYNTSDQTITVDQLLKAYSKIPDEIRSRGQKKIIVHDVYNPQDSYWQRMYKNFTHSYMTGGDTIDIWKHSGPHDDAYLVQALSHEMGHGIDKNNGRFSATQKWIDAMKDDLKTSGKPSPTTYGENSNGEDFAESVGQWAVGRTGFEKAFPERAKLLKTLLGLTP